MITPGLISAIGGLVGACIVPPVLVYIKGSNAEKLNRLNNKTVSEQLFRDELKKRDEAIYRIEQDMKDLTDKYTDQRERDLTEIESWKGKYEEQVEVNTKLQTDFEALKKTVTQTI